MAQEVIQIIEEKTFATNFGDDSEKIKKIGPIFLGGAKKVRFILDIHSLTGRHDTPIIAPSYTDDALTDSGGDTVTVRDDTAGISARTVEPKVSLYFYTAPSNSQNTNWLENSWDSPVGYPDPNPSQYQEVTRIYTRKRDEMHGDWAMVFVKFSYGGTATDYKPQVTAILSLTAIVEYD
jgi:hypothetical protein